MTVGFMEKIYNAHKENKTIKHGGYEYAIQYNPIASIHTWIIRRKVGKNELAETVYGEWSFYSPLTLFIGMWN